MKPHKIEFLYLSQEDLLKSGCLDINLAMDAAERGMLSFATGDILFPEKIAQIFNDETQERINCLPSTLLLERICGAKWVSVFPPNPIMHGKQNLSAVFILSEIETGFPIAFMEGTLASNIRVGAMGGLAARYLSREDSRIIGFIGAGEQAKMHLVAMKTVRPGLEICRVSGKTSEEEDAFIAEMSALFPDLDFDGTRSNGERAMGEADILVTATSVQAPLLKAAWMKPGTFYSHIGGWEDEYAVAKQCEKIVCDDWETVKHRTQTLSRMYQDGELRDDEVYADLVELVSGAKPGRESDDECAYFNAVGLSFVDVAIAHAMYLQALDRGVGQMLTMQDTMIFEHDEIAEWVRL